MCILFRLDLPNWFAVRDGIVRVRICHMWLIRCPFVVAISVSNCQSPMNLRSAILTVALCNCGSPFRVSRFLGDGGRIRLVIVVGWACRISSRGGSFLFAGGIRACLWGRNRDVTLGLGIGSWSHSRCQLIDHLDEIVVLTITGLFVL